MPPSFSGSSQNRRPIHGEQALAYGALWAGVHLVAGYPGSPGLGTMNAIIEHARQHGHPYVEWSLNERVALEIGIGVSMAGRRSLVCTKSVGMNVLLDPLMTLNLTGVHGGLVILLGDDPGAYGSQNEQDTRLLAPMIEIPMLEPASPAEAYAMMGEAFELSERFNTAIVIRITRSFAQMVGQFTPEIVPTKEAELGLAREPYRFVPYPGNAVEMHRRVHARLEAFEAWAATAAYNQVTGRGPKGILAPGYAYRKLLDVVGDRPRDQFRVLKLGTLYPLPKATVARFLEGCEEVLVLEEPDACIESALKVLAHDLGSPARVHGKQDGRLPEGDELLRWQIQAALEEYLPGFQPARVYRYTNADQERPSKENYCAASPNERVLALLQEAASELGQHPILIGDPGCWVKVAGELDGKFAIGSAVAVASGLQKAGVEERVVALFGDSAYFHSALPAICNAAYDRSGIFMLLLDNGGAVSTGAQPTPASGVDALGNPAPRLSIAEIALACGVPDVRRIPAGAPDAEIKAALRAGLEDRGLVLLVLEVEISPEFT